MLYFKKIDIEICYQRNGCSVDLIIKGKNAGVGILWVSQKGVQFKKEKRANRTRSRIKRAI